MKLFVSLLILGASAFAQIENTTISKPNSKDLSDGEIAAAIISYNEEEIQTGQDAISLSRTPAVRSYAKAMIDEHQTSEEISRKLAEKRNIDIRDGELSRKVQKQAREADGSLQRAVDLDQTYLRGQLRMHENALQLLDTVLIPSARDEHLREHLMNTRMAIQLQLNHAKQLRAAVIPM